MNDHESAESGAPSQTQERKAWTAPVVTYLSMDDTANSATVGNDGNGTFTGS